MRGILCAGQAFGCTLPLQPVERNECTATSTQYLNRLEWCGRKRGQSNRIASNAKLPYALHCTFAHIQKINNISYLQISYDWHWPYFFVMNYDTLYRSGGYIHIIIIDNWHYTIKSWKRKKNMRCDTLLQNRLTSRGISLSSIQKLAASEKIKNTFISIDEYLWRFIESLTRFA